jgi:hypothetical protein
MVPEKIGNKNVKKFTEKFKNKITGFKRTISLLCTSVKNVIDKKNSTLKSQAFSEIVKIVELQRQKEEFEEQKKIQVRHYQ